MIGRLNHIAIAVPDLAKASELYAGHGRKVSRPRRSRRTASRWCSSSCPTPRSSCCIRSARSRRSPISCRNADGGIHHVCYEVEDIYAARDKLKAEGARVLGDGEPRSAPTTSRCCSASQGLHGTLIELEQV
jgi:methylmalonyl-CoA/ethylmalonyl-CoA epimerase